MADVCPSVHQMKRKAHPAAAADRIRRQGGKDKGKEESAGKLKRDRKNRRRVCSSKKYRCSISNRIELLKKALNKPNLSVPVTLRLAMARLKKVDAENAKLKKEKKHLMTALSTVKNEVSGQKSAKVEKISIGVGTNEETSNKCVQVVADELECLPKNVSGQKSAKVERISIGVGTNEKTSNKCVQVLADELECLPKNADPRSNNVESVKKRKLTLKKKSLDETSDTGEVSRKAPPAAEAENANPKEEKICTVKNEADPRSNNAESAKKRKLTLNKESLDETSDSAEVNRKGELAAEAENAKPKEEKICTVKNEADSRSNNVESVKKRKLTLKKKSLDETSDTGEVSGKAPPAAEFDQGIVGIPKPALGGTPPKPSGSVTTTTNRRNATTGVQPRFVFMDDGTVRSIERTERNVTEQQGTPAQNVNKSPTEKSRDVTLASTADKPADQHVKGRRTIRFVRKLKNEPDEKNCDTATPTVNTPPMAAPTVKIEPTEENCDTAAPTVNTPPMAAPTVKIEPTEENCDTAAAAPTVNTISMAAPTVNTPPMAAPTVSTPPMAAQDVKNEPPEKNCDTATLTVNTPPMAAPTVSTRSISAPTVNTRRMTAPIVNTRDMTTQTVNMRPMAAPTVNTRRMFAHTVNTCPMPPPTANTRSIAAPTVNTPPPMAVPTVNNEPTEKKGDTATSTVNTRAISAPTVNRRRMTAPSVNTRDKATQTFTFNLRPVAVPTVTTRGVGAPTANTRPMAAPTANTRGMVTPTVNPRSIAAPTVTARGVVTQTANTRSMAAPTANQRDMVAPTVNMPGMAVVIPNLPSTKRFPFPHFSVEELDPARTMAEISRATHSSNIVEVVSTESNQAGSSKQEEDDDDMDHSS